MPNLFVPDVQAEDEASYQEYIKQLHATAETINKAGLDFLQATVVNPGKDHSSDTCLEVQVKDLGDTQRNQEVYKKLGLDVWAERNPVVSDKGTNYIAGRTDRHSGSDDYDAARVHLSFLEVNAKALPDELKESDRERAQAPGAKLPEGGKSGGPLEVVGKEVGS